MVNLIVSDSRPTDSLRSGAPSATNAASKLSGRDPISHGGAAAFVYDALKERISNGDLPPGVRIVETVIAEELGVSRTPVREAIQRLVSEGVVSRDRSKGLSVVELSGEEIEDLYVTRMVLEGLAARLTATRRSTNDMLTLAAIQDAMERALADGDAQRLADVNFEFHAEIQRIAGNSTTSRFMAQIHESVRRFGSTTLSLPDRAHQALEEHRQLIAAFHERDADRAEAIARRHIEGALHARLAIVMRRRLAGKGSPA